MANPYFNATYYLTNNPDLFANGINTAESAWNHYVNHGAAESLNGGTSRQPAPWFDATYYLKNNPDLAIAKLQPGQLFEHFVNHGIAEGRAPSAAAVMTETNLLAYAKGNADLLEAFGIEASATELTDAQEAALAGHFYQFGYKESRPAAPFDANVDPGKVGETFTLTINADNVEGTSGNDTINGAVGSTTTFQTADVIDGKGGIDTLSVTFDGASPAFPAATISNVEVFKLRDAGNTAGLSVDFAAIGGETEVWSDRSTNAGGATTFNNLATGTKVGIIGQNGAITNNELAFTYATGTDAVNLAFADGVKQTAGLAAVSSTSSATTATITSSGAANTVGQITLTGAKLTSVTVDAQSNFTANGGAAAAGILGFDAASTSATLTVKGAGKANVGLLDTNVDVVDATGNAGGLTAIISAAGQQITGGAGNDTITTLAAGTLMTKVVDAGAGTGDKLIINGAALVDTIAKGAQFKNFEVLQVNSGAAAAAQDVANLSANNTFTSAVINQSTTNATGISNMNATMAGAVTVLAASGTGAITFGIKDASVAGNIDTLKLTLDDGQATTVAPATFTLTAPVMTGIEKLEIVNNENTTISTLASATALDDVKVSGSGAFTVTTTGTVDFAANTKFDFSGVTGAVSFSAAAAQAGATATGLSITGSATAANTLADSVKSDVIVGGAKGDTLAFLGGADIISLGGGADVTTFNAAAKGSNILGAGVTFKFADGDSVAVAGSGTGLGIGFDATKTDTITGFDVTALSTTDGAKFTLDTAQAAGAFTVVTSAVQLGTTTVTNAFDFLVVNDTANSAAYVYQDTNGNKTIDAGDFAIKLVGSAALAAGEFSLSTGGDLVFAAN